ncbi:MAG: hypothetical protein IT360_09135 [Gemmatimonadaceae bacterium]|nr:hypothetical protein [Gemmatimonadaceae bacterium]
METALLDWLARTGSRVFTLAAWGFVLVNGAAVAAVFLTRDRTLVNRWTGRLLAANLVLVGGGLGIPLLASAARLAITEVSPTVRISVPVSDQELDELPPASVRDGIRGR